MENVRMEIPDVSILTCQPWFTIACAMVSGLLGSLLALWCENHRERKISQNVAYAVVFSLQREVAAGLRRIEETRQGKYACVGCLPTNGWESLQTLLSDRNVLDAIIRHGKNGKVADSQIGKTFGDIRFEPYQVEEVLSHIKNYFCYIVPNFIDATPSNFANTANIAELYVGATNVNLTLKKILDGLSRRNPIMVAIGAASSFIASHFVAIAALLLCFLSAVAIAKWNLLEMAHHGFAASTKCEITQVSTYAMPHQSRPDRTWLWSGLIAVAGAISGACLTHMLTGIRERKNNRIVGKAIVQAFKEEISTGKHIIKSNIDSILSGSNKRLPMPMAMWLAYGTRISEGILSEIVKVRKRENDKGFPINEFPLHLARYYYYICPNVDLCSKTADTTKKDAVAKLKELLEATDGVLTMLDTIEKRISGDTASEVPEAKSAAN